MNILLSNDDGIEAEGIKTLALRLRAAGHNLLVIAPSRERSAASHAATFGRPLYLRKYEGIEGVRAFSLSGKPADCVKFGIMQFKDEFPVELVISGINRGQNLGTDIIYSGTVSAAQEGALLGVNSIAVSCEYHRDKAGKYNYFSKQIDYTRAADFIVEKLPFFARHAARDTFFNVNVPGTDDIKGVKTVKHGRSRYNDYYERRTDEKGGEYFLLLGEHADDEESISEECDLKYFNAGYITITPIFYSRTNFEKLKQLENE